jgi:hypothetical protein
MISQNPSSSFLPTQISIPTTSISSSPHPNIDYIPPELINNFKKKKHIKLEDVDKLRQITLDDIQPQPNAVLLTQCGKKVPKVISVSDQRIIGDIGPDFDPKC